MKPKVKALELIDKFTLEGNYLQKFDDSKAQALICVDEILKAGILLAKYELDEDELTKKHLEYWQEVKSIIQEL